MRTGRYHHGDLRAALLAQAELALQEHGPDALSLRELARALEVSHAAPSRHFRDKRALLDALALTGIQRISAAARERLAAAGPGFDARIRAFAGAYVDFAAERPAMLELTFIRKHDPAVTDELRTAWQPLESEAHQVIVDGQRAGLVRPGSPARVFEVLFTAVHGVAARAAAGVLTGPALARVLDDVVDHLLRGLVPAPGDTPLAPPAAPPC
ncbi:MULTISPECIES: TetR/AcrR family transcriptional regulator [Kitasatospora]|uniref:Putative TetR family transcriptional regulator n=1 Tax=Kitasatospora setae (strain ATCC 33774 / DSM 43861 / JCM 3304 / KCC A-0304 / NBRC 14216 / KM-6054) TaxID=452652 RepID=E4NHV9_KITSK|nr:MULTISPECIES: TetR/AcrR family transcriptional regulator [Kitasatospora]BAJ31089.1 putative TetR family transcriptional regulator [Kitasatospora setae KM-6054]